MNKIKRKDFPANHHEFGFSALEQHLLHFKLAITKFALSVGSSIKSPYSGIRGTWPEQLEQMRWRHKLRYIDFHRVKGSWMEDVSLLPGWAQKAIAKNQLYLLAYVPAQNAHSAIYLSTAMSMAARSVSSGIEADEAISSWCRRSGFNVTGTCLNSFLDEETVNRLASRSADTRYLLTDLPFTH
ncbi:hypothetical protein [Endozoicomonas arenosclerae]|uniref:hypothetical protein n=1 Tax=Endozoicomonas arenosclerae TaxID=1633495 RepID=UPI0007842667|nr:hypothetical protein [Endozoicomonas arenosclerae]